MRFGILLAAAAALASSTAASAAHFIRFEIKADGEAEIFDPFFNPVPKFPDGTIQASFTFSTRTCDGTQFEQGCKTSLAGTDSYFLRNSIYQLSGTVTGSQASFTLQPVNLSVQQTMAHAAYSLNAPAGGHFDLQFLEPYIYAKGSIIEASLVEFDSATLSEAGFRFQFMESAVPEPAAWTMMLAGFGVVGAAIRRHRSRHQVSVSL